MATPAVWEAQTIKITIDTYGKAAKYGPDVYKVGHGERQLTAAGWVSVHRGTGYVYMRAPAGKGTKRPVVTVSVPTWQEVKEFALRLHAAGAPWDGEAFGWPGSYQPARTVGVRVQSDWDRPPERKQLSQPASFALGESLVWQRYAYWDNGPDAEPRWGEHGGSDD